MIVGPEAEAARWTRHKWCWLPGEPCFKVKRSAEPLAEVVTGSLGQALAEPSLHKWCWVPGGPCTKIKSAIEVLDAAKEN